ncbi:MAG TPA: hypothetical protein VGH28_22045 [Polyangiaceae bacterium]|jgi:hypothetical protein
MLSVRAATTAIGVSLVGCGGAAAPAAPAVTVQAAPTAEATDTMPRAPQAAAMRWLGTTLESAGHACHLSGETLVCDEKKENVATVGLVWANEQALGPYIGYVASFNWKEPGACEKSAPKLNELSSKFDLLRMTCSDENLVFALTVPLGERSLTAADVKGLTTYFQTLVGTVLRSSGLVPLLK